jgi:hypothetical protein
MVMKLTKTKASLYHLNSNEVHKNNGNQTTRMKEKRVGLGKGRGSSFAVGRDNENLQ